jgi:hypothetical protein
MKSESTSKINQSSKLSEWINRQHGTRPKCQQPPEQAAGLKALSSKTVEVKLTL